MDIQLFQIGGPRFDIPLDYQSLVSRTPRLTRHDLPMLRETLEKYVAAASAPLDTRLSEEQKKTLEQGKFLIETLQESCENSKLYSHDIAEIVQFAELRRMYDNIDDLFKRNQDFVLGSGQGYLGVTTKNLEELAAQGSISFGQAARFAESLLPAFKDFSYMQSINEAYDDEDNDSYDIADIVQAIDGLGHTVEDESYFEKNPLKLNSIFREHVTVDKEDAVLVFKHFDTLKQMYSNSNGYFNKRLAEKVQELEKEYDDAVLAILEHSRPLSDELESAMDTLRLREVKEYLAQYLAESDEANAKLIEDETTEVTELKPHVEDSLYRIYNEFMVPLQEKIRLRYSRLPELTERLGRFSSALDKFAVDQDIPERVIDIEEGKVLVGADIHGNLDDWVAFKHRFYDAVKRFPDEPVYMVVAGDIIDQRYGPDDSPAVLEDVMQLQEEHPGRIIVLPGNHEAVHPYGIRQVASGNSYVYEMLKDAVVKDIAEESIDEDEREQVLKDRMERYMAFIRDMPLAVRTAGGVIITHAGATDTISSLDDLRKVDYDSLESQAVVREVAAKEGRIQPAERTPLVGLTWKSDGVFGEGTVAKAFDPEYVADFLRAMSDDKITGKAIVCGHHGPDYVKSRGLDTYTHSGLLEIGNRTIVVNFEDPVDRDNKKMLVLDAKRDYTQGSLTYFDSAVEDLHIPLSAELVGIAHREFEKVPEMKRLIAHTFDILSPEVQKLYQAHAAALNGGFNEKEYLESMKAQGIATRGPAHPVHSLAGLLKNNDGLGLLLFERQGNQAVPRIITETTKYADGSIVSKKRAPTIAEVYGLDQKDADSFFKRNAATARIDMLHQLNRRKLLRGGVNAQVAEYHRLACSDDYRNFEAAHNDSVEAAVLANKTEGKDLRSAYLDEMYRLLELDASDNRFHSRFTLTGEEKARFKESTVGDIQEQERLLTLVEKHPHAAYFFDDIANPKYEIEEEDGEEEAYATSIMAELGLEGFEHKGMDANDISTARVINEKREGYKTNPRESYEALDGDENFERFEDAHWEAVEAVNGDQDNAFRYIAEMRQRLEEVKDVNGRYFFHKLVQEHPYAALFLDQTGQPITAIEDGEKVPISLEDALGYDPAAAEAEEKRQEEIDRRQEYLAERRKTFKKRLAAVLVGIGVFTGGNYVLEKYIKPLIQDTVEQRSDQESDKDSGSK